jgi:hypothetical protein
MGVHIGRRERNCETVARGSRAAAVRYLPVVFASSFKPEPQGSPLVRYFEVAATLATPSYLAVRALA